MPTNSDSYREYFAQQHFCAVKLNGLRLGEVPTDEISHALCCAAVKNEPRAIKFVPAEFRDENLALVIANIGKATKDLDDDDWELMSPTLQYVPETLRTYDVCRTAVSRDERNLEFVPKQMQLAHPDLCVTAVNQSRSMLKHVDAEVFIAYPDIWHQLSIMKRKTSCMGLKYQVTHPDLLKKLVENDPSELHGIAKIVLKKHPQIYQNTLALLKESPENIVALPISAQKQHLDIWRQYLEMKPTSSGLESMNPAIQKMIPDAVIREIRRRPALIKYLCADIGMHNPGLYEFVVAYDASLLKYVPAPIRAANPQILRAAIANNPDVAYENINATEFAADPSLYDDLLNKNPRLISKIPEHAKTPRLCRFVLMRAPELIRYIPLQYWTLPDFMNAVSADETIIRMAPARLLTYKLCLDLINQKAYNYKYLPEWARLKYPELGRIAIDKDPEAFTAFPSSLQMQHVDVCCSVVAYHPSYIQHVDPAVQMAHPQVCQCLFHAYPKHIGSINKAALKKHWDFIHSTPSEFLQAKIKAVQSQSWYYKNYRDLINSR